MSELPLPAASAHPVPDQKSAARGFRRPHPHAGAAARSHGQRSACSVIPRAPSTSMPSYRSAAASLARRSLTSGSP